MEFDLVERYQGIRRCVTIYHGLDREMCEERRDRVHNVRDTQVPRRVVRSGHPRGDRPMTLNPGNLREKPPVDVRRRIVVPCDSVGVGWTERSRTVWPDSVATGATPQGAKQPCSPSVLQI